MSLPSDNTRIIWVVPKYPLGIPDGARHATCTLVRHITQRAVPVDLICLLPEGESADAAAAKQDLGVASCALIRRSRSKYFPLPAITTPFTIRTFAAAGVRRAFQRELAALLAASESSRTTHVVFDGLHTFGALSQQDLQNLSAKCRGIIYRAHNFETTFWEQCAEQAHLPWSRWFFRYQTALVGHFERRIARQADLIAPVSEEDAARFKQAAPEATVSVIPIGMDFPDEKTVQAVRDTTPFELLFVGRLDWLPNRNGLTWFLETIWPQLIVKRPQVSLKIAGVGNGDWLKRFAHLPGIEFLGKVADLKPLYESCALSIAPLFQGSGTRVKILESARYARASLTTALGAEGSGLIPGSSYFQAEGQDQWLDLLQSINHEACRKTGWLAFQSARERFDAKTIAGRFVQALEGIPHE